MSKTTPAFSLIEEEGRLADFCDGMGLPLFSHEA